MDQEKGAGHHIITTTAVRRLFAARARDGKILGLTEPEFARALDDAQEYMDRWYGPTILPFWLDEAAQKEHGIADPHLTAAENVKQIQGWIDDNTVKAVLLAQQHKIGDAIKALGAAVHALEDSYSEAHMWRAASEHFGVETAEIQQIMVFDPTGISGGGGIIADLLHLKDVTMGTHDEWFDKVPLDKRGQMVEGDDQAATNAVVRLLNTFVTAYDPTSIPAGGTSEAEDYRVQSHARMDGTLSAIQSMVEEGIAPMFQLARGAKVAKSPDAAYDAERHQRRAVDQAQINDADRVRAPEIEFAGALSFDPVSPTGGDDLTVSWREVNKGGPAASYTATLAWTDGAGDHESALPSLALGQNDSAVRTSTVTLSPGAAEGRFTVSLQVPGAGGPPPHLTASVRIAKASIFKRRPAG